MKKSFTLDENPIFAAIKADSHGVCGIYINGEFLEASCGRYRGRICNFECTSLLKQGENEILLVLGSHFFEAFGTQTYKERGYWFLDVAIELSVTLSAGTKNSKRQ